MRGKWLSKGIFLMSIIAVSLTGCGSRASLATSAADTSYEDSEPAAYEAPAQEAPAVAESNDYAESEKSEENGVSVPNIDTTSAYNRKIIKTGNMSLQTKDFAKTVEEIMAAVQLYNGYVQDMQLSGDSYYDGDQKLQSATITVRIPQQSFDKFINNGDKYGNVVTLNCNTEDVTASYVDAQTRLEVLKTRYDRLLALMAKVEDYDDIFRFEREIADVEYEINSYQGKLNHYDSVVDLSTLQIDVQEVAEEEEIPEVKEETFGDKIKKGFNDSWEGVVSLLSGLLLIIVRLIPSLVILVPLALVGLVIYKKVRKGQKASTKEDIKEDVKEENKE